MPIYEYVCQDCNTKFDALRSIRDADTPITCTHCQSQKTSRMISVFFAQSSNGAITKSSNGGGCAGCSSGSCAACGR